jgi:hypothetical protein
MVNYLHECLGRLAKYLLEAADVECHDKTGRETGYRLEPAPAAGPEAIASAGTGDADTQGTRSEAAS